jgi:hypothetical protein
LSGLEIEYCSTIEAPKTSGVPRLSELVETG